MKKYRKVSMKKIQEDFNEEERKDEKKKTRKVI